MKSGNDLWEFHFIENDRRSTENYNHDRRTKGDTKSLSLSRHIIA